MADDNIEKIRAQYIAISSKKNKTPEDIQKVQRLLAKADLIADTPEERKAYGVLYKNAMDNIVVPYGQQRLDDYEKNIDNSISAAKRKIAESDDDAVIAEQKAKIDKFNQSKKTYIQPNRKNFALLEMSLSYTNHPLMAGVPTNAQLNLYGNVLKTINDPKAQAIYKVATPTKQPVTQQLDTNGNPVTATQPVTTTPGANYQSQRGSYSTETTRYGTQADRTGQPGNVDDLTDIKYGTGLPEIPLNQNIDTTGAGFSSNQSQMSQNPEYNYRSTGTDTAGYLIDVGRTILGTKGAMEEVPTYEPSEMFQNYTQEASNMRNMGLSQNELSYAQGQAEKGYAYDVKNINRYAGGSSGVALANLGRATNQLQDAYGNISMRDEAVRRMNRQNFGQAALASEDVNRQQFQDKLGQTMMNKQSGAQLANDALNNILNRRDFERYYGPGSLSEAYKNEQLKETALTNQAMQSQVDYYQRGANVLNSVNQQQSNPTSLNVDTKMPVEQQQTMQVKSSIPGDVTTTEKPCGTLLKSQVENTKNVVPGSEMQPPSGELINYRNQQFDTFMKDYEPKKAALQAEMNNAKTGSLAEKRAKAELDALQKQYTEFQTKIGETTEEQINYR